MDGLPGYMYIIYRPCVHSTYGGQKWALDALELIADICELCWCRQKNSGPLEECS